MYKYIQFLFLVSVVVVMLAVQALFAGVMVCQSCGWEVKPSAEVCGHCGAVVQADEAEPVSVEPVESEPDESREAALIEDSTVDSEIKLCRQYSSAGEGDVALLFLKNASILNMLSKSAGDRVRSTAISRMLAEADGKGVFVSTKCLTCGGSGKRMMKIGSIIPGEEAKVREVEGSVCPVCGGRGLVRRVGNLDDRKFAQGRAESKFAVIQQGRNYRRVGGAWLPADAVDRLSVRQTALVRSSSAAPCEECLGLGKTDCPDCNATGVIDCKNCEGGNVFIKVEGTLVTGTMSRSEKCKNCGGRGVVVCEKCSGTGGILCKTCQGRGDRPECGKCGARGYTECRKCRGTGTAGDSVCEACGGEGAVLCSSCKGEGHK